MSKPKISQAPSIRRLPSYLVIIKQAHRDGLEYISGTVIAQELNLEPIQVRKDLAITGIIGKPKKGYPTVALVAAIERFLGWDRVVNAILFGAGNLGSALMGYQEFRAHGLAMVAAFDSDPRKVGQTIHGIVVRGLEELPSIVSDRKVKTALLTVPSPFAQESAELLVSCGIESIWNFTNTKLKVPDEVIVQKEDLSSGYAMLCVQMLLRERRADGERKD